MDITEEKIKQIALETQRVLGTNAHPEMIKKVVRAVVDRLSKEQVQPPIHKN